MIGRLQTTSISRHAVLIILMMFLLAPTVIMLSTSFKNFGAINSWPPQLIPENPTLSSFSTVLFNPSYNFARAFVNSCAIAVFTAAFAVLVGTPAAYAVRRFQFVGKKFFLFGVLTTQMLSPALFIMPLYQVMNTLGLLNTYVALVIGNSAIAVPVVIWLLASYFKGIPTSLEEAARVDGASRLQALFRIILPVSAPGILAAGAYAFIRAWNDLVFALSFVTSSEMQPVTRALDRFAAENVVRWNLTMAASTLAIIPIVLLFASLQKHLVSGIAVGSNK